MRNCIPLAVMFLATINGATLCAADTTVYTWGYSGWGQLGNESLGGGIGVDSFIKVPTAIARTATTVVAGADNCYAITATGSLYAWGKNLVGQVGQIGDGTNKPQASPVAITAAANRWLSLDCKTIRPVGIMQPTGSPPAKLYWWGQVRQEYYCSVASVTVGSGGTGYKVGDSVTFRCDNGGGGFALVGAIDDGPPLDGYGRITSIVVTRGGAYLSLPSVVFPEDRPASPASVTPPYPARNGATGTAVMSSVNAASETEVSVSEPALVPFNGLVPDWTDYTVARGTNHGMLLNKNPASTDYGTLFSFGYNDYGQLGLGHRNFVTGAGPKLPPPVAGGVWAAVSCGLHFTVGISTLGHMYTWGMNDDRGQLGHGAFNTNMGTAAADPVTLSPKQIMPGIVWASVACGYDHTLALTASGELFAWGSNSCGELGIGSNENTPGPTKVGDGWTSIAAGDRVSFGFKGSQAYSWGNNKLGQLGIGTTENANSPRLLTFSGTMISAGGSHAVGR